MTGEKRDIYAEVTAEIVAMLEAGTVPWRRPWDTGKPLNKPLRACGKPYTGINVIRLWGVTVSKGYASPYWMTFNQAKALGGCVRKGEKGYGIVYYGGGTRTKTDDEGEEQRRQYRFLKSYTVFNAEQVEGLPDSFKNVVQDHGTQPIPAVLELVAKAGVNVVEVNRGASYASARDIVLMPPTSAFVSADAWAATMLHECVHWTGHKDRLNRVLSCYMGDEDYCREELVAELGAAFLCADLGVVDHPREQAAAYLDHWLGNLKEDKTYIFTAAAAAAKAADFLHGKTQDQPQGEEVLA